MGVLKHVIKDLDSKFEAQIIEVAFKLVELMKNKAKIIIDKFKTLWHCFRVDKKMFLWEPW